ncbi:MAG: hypothetical protein M0042_01190 [Nitrospiraceae bacterium]|nr:hypothetical protein [Nitrospiraceae bacterium]
MPIIMVLLALLLYAPSAYAHPGKTDLHGGHRCLKKCAEWDLYYAEYHLHDKDGKPIRVPAKRQGKKPKQEPEPAVVPEAPAIAESAQPAAHPATVRPVAAAAVTVGPDLPLLPAGLLLLLLLWLLIRRRRAGQEVS